MGRRPPRVGLMTGQDEQGRPRRAPGDRIMRAGAVITVIGLICTLIAILPLVIPSLSLPSAWWFLSMLTGVEMFRKLLDEGQAGDNIGALLRGTKKEDVERGQVLCKPGSITPHTNFEGQVYVLKKEEGGRHKPFFNNYRPQFFFRTTDVTGTIQLPAGTEMVMPGDNVVMTVELGKPIAMDEGLRFAIREGGRTVGAGRVTKILK